MSFYGLTAKEKPHKAPPLEGFGEGRRLSSSSLQPASCSPYFIHNHQYSNTFLFMDIKVSGGRNLFYMAILVPVTGGIANTQAKLPILRQRLNAKLNNCFIVSKCTCSQDTSLRCIPHQCRMHPLTAKVNIQTA